MHCPPQKSFLTCMLHCTDSRSDSDGSSETESKHSSKHHFTPTRDLRTALTEYYAYYNPEKLCNIDKIVNTFGRTPGGLLRMFNKLRDLYGVAPAYVDPRLDEQTPGVQRPGVQRPGVQRPGVQRPQDHVGTDADRGGDAGQWRD